MLKHKYQYLNKRTKDNIILRFDACRKTQEATEKCFHLISSSNLYKLLCTNFPEKYIEIYFKKLFYIELNPIVNQILIYKWEVENKTKNKLGVIETKTFSLPKLLPNIFSDIAGIKLKHGFDFIKLRKNIDRSLALVRDKCLNLKNLFTKKSYSFFEKEKNYVAVNYREGISDDKRSDLFWLYNSGINIPNIILYIETYSFFKRYKEEKIIENLNKTKKINIIKIWELDKFKKKSYYKKIKNELINASENNYLDKILLKKSTDLLEKIEFWHSFFEKYKIKIHFDHNETDVDLAIKQIALHLTNSCSIGKARSYYCNSRGLHYYLFPVDIFCTWGRKSIENLRKNVLSKTESNINNVLVTGYPYRYITEKVKTKIQIMQNQLQNKNTRFNILLLDNGAGNNKDYIYQLPSYHLFKKFYNFFFKWVVEDKEVGLIIKPKRFSVFKNTNVEEAMNKAIKTGRCCIEEESFGSIPWHYSKLANMIVSVSSLTIPTAMLECLINNKKTKAIFFDYPNLKNIEPDLYFWGKDRVVFNNMDTMLSSLKNYKNNPSSKEDLGSWTEDYINNLDAHMDDKFSYRTCNYVANLLKAFNNGLDKNGAIDMANKNFSEKWGKENILITNNKLARGI